MSLFELVKISLSDEQITVIEDSKFIRNVMIQMHLLLISPFHYRVHMPAFALIIIRKTTIHRTIKTINETREKVDLENQKF